MKSFLTTFERMPSPEAMWRATPDEFQPYIPSSVAIRSIPPEVAARSLMATGNGFRSPVSRIGVTFPPGS